MKTIIQTPDKFVKSSSPDRLTSMAIKFILYVSFLLTAFQIDSKEHPITMIFGGDCTFSDSFSANIKPN